MQFGNTFNVLFGDPHLFQLPTSFYAFVHLFVGTVLSAFIEYIESINKKYDDEVIMNGYKNVLNKAVTGRIDNVSIKLSYAYMKCYFFIPLTTNSNLTCNEFKCYRNCISIKFKQKQTNCFLYEEQQTSSLQVSYKYAFYENMQIDEIIICL